MKTLTLFSFLNLVVLIVAYPQKGTFVLRDSTYKEGSITANTDNELYLSGGHVLNFQDIVRATFKNVNDGAKRNIDLLRAKGIKVVILNTKSNDPIYNNGLDKAAVVDRDIRSNWEQFDKQRSGGKVMQMIGVIGLGLTSYLMADNYEKAKDGKELHEIPVALPIGSTAVFIIGTAIDIGAGKHLRKQ